MTYLYVFIFCPFGRALSDTLRRQPSAAAVLIYPVRRVQRPGVCALPCMVCLASGTACAAVCRVQSFRVRWTGQGGTGGVYSRRPAPPGQSLYHRKNKKGFKKFAAGFSATKNFSKNKKDPYKGSVFCVILALQALKGRNL